MHKNSKALYTFCLNAHLVIYLQLLIEKYVLMVECYALFISDFPTEVECASPNLVIKT